MAGGAARVEHRPAEALVLRFVGGAGGDEVVEVLESFGARCADHERELDARAALVGERLGDLVDEVMADDDCLRPGVAEDVGDLGGDEVPVDRHEHDAGVRAGERRLEPLVAVAADDRDRVAGSDAGVAEAVDQAVDPLVEFGPGAGAGVVGEGELVALLGSETEVRTAIDSISPTRSGTGRTGPADRRTGSTSSRLAKSHSPSTRV